jgi:hypothetical protein
MALLQVLAGGASMSGRTPELLPPILHECRRYRHAQMGPHRDHVAEFERLRASGRLLDEVWADAIRYRPEPAEPEMT